MENTTLSYLLPKMTLERFEAAYRALVSKHGQKNADLIAASMKATTEALGLQFAAPAQAEKEIKKHQDKLNELISVAATTLETAEQAARELEEKARTKRINAKAAAQAMEAEKTSHASRIQAINEISKIF